MTAQSPNAELAYKVLDHIDAHPEQWYQGLWISRADSTDCGTSGCFAGWACMLSGNAPAWEADEQASDFVIVSTGENRPVDEQAIDLLGIDDDQADELFDAYNTREDLDRKVTDIFGPRPGGDAR